MHGPRGAARAAAAPPPDDRLVGLRARAALPRPLDEARRPPARHQCARRPAPPAVHRRERAARHLPLRHVRPAARRGRARPLLVGHDRQAHRRRLLARRHQHVDGAAPRASPPPPACTRGDLVQMAFPYGMFTGGWGLHYGIERIGATIIPAGGGQHRAPPRDDAGLRHDGARLDALLRPLPRREGRGARRRPRRAQAAARPLRRRAVLRPDEGRDRGASSASAPPTTTASPRSWARASPASASAPAACTSTRTTCCSRSSTRRAASPCAYGEEGELVITTLTKEAFPLLRYRTHDLTSLDPSRCECGRTLARMRKVRQRTDDMLIVRGVNVFPSQIEDVLFDRRGRRARTTSSSSTASKSLDDLEVRLEVEESLFSDVMADMVRLQRLGRRQAPVGARPARPRHARRAGRDRAHRRQGEARAGPARRGVGRTARRRRRRAARARVESRA